MTDAADYWTICDRCGCGYSSTWRPEGSLCEDLSGALDRWPLDGSVPTEDELREGQCVGICRRTVS